MEPESQRGESTQETARTVTGEVAAQLPKPDRPSLGG